MAEERDELDILLDEGARKLPSEPQPGGWYSPEGDCVFFYRENVPTVAERVDGLLTIYRAEADGRIVGAQIKGFAKLPPHDLFLLRLGRNKSFDILELLLATFYRQVRGGVLDEPERAKRYEEAASVLRGRVPVQESEIPGR